MSIKSYNGKNSSQSSPFQSSTSSDLKSATVSFSMNAASPEIYSKSSGPMPYETLFNDFELDVTPVYNFWVPDELVNDADALGNRNPAEVPRYMMLTWKVAPDLKKRDPSNANKKNARSANVGLGPETTLSYSDKGLSFNVAHMQKDNFSLVVNSVSNGHMAPGTIEAVVSLSVGNLGLEKTDAYSSTQSKYDEDAFLDNPDMSGVSFHELIAQEKHIIGGTMNAAFAASDGVSDKNRDKKEQLFDGQFALYKSQNGDNTVQLNGTNSTSSNISITMKVPERKDKKAQGQVSSMIKSISHSQANSSTQEEASIRAKFVDPSIVGTIGEKKVATMTRPEHAENMAAIATVLPHLEVMSQCELFNKNRKNSVLSYSSPKDVMQIEYVGYVIEKFTQLDSGVFQKTEEIHIPSREYDSYIDTKILYGTIYRYRIKTIVRWTRPSNIDVNGKNGLSPEKNGTETSKLANYSSSYFCSEWNKKWMYASCIDDHPVAPPDEFTVRPNSFKKEIYVSFKLPWNPQKDITRMELYRKTFDASGNEISGWKVISDAVGPIYFDPKNILYIDQDVDFFQNNGLLYVYSALCYTRHGVYSTRSDQLATRLNKDHVIYGEYPTMFVSCQGVDKDNFGAFSVYPYKEYDETLIEKIDTSDGKFANKSVVLEGREATGISQRNDGDYVVRIESLDTGEKRDVDVSLKYINGKIQTSKFGQSAYVSSDKRGA